jgi:hypothetical protein
MSLAGITMIHLLSVAITWMRHGKHTQQGSCLQIAGGLTNGPQKLKMWMLNTLVRLTKICRLVLFAVLLMRGENMFLGLITFQWVCIFLLVIIVGFLVVDGYLHSDHYRHTSKKAKARNREYVNSQFDAFHEGQRKKALKKLESAKYEN